MQDKDTTKFIFIYLNQFKIKFLRLSSSVVDHAVYVQVEQLLCTSTDFINLGGLAYEKVQTN